MLQQGMTMLTRMLAGLAMLFTGYLLHVPSVEANVFPQLEPCLAKNMPQVRMLPAGTHIIQVMGHNFRNDDQCVPFYVTFTWENHYARDDGYSQYSIKFKQTFTGEFWYSSDKEEFTLVGNPGQWKGLSKVRAFDGYGQVCTDYDENDKCVKGHKFDGGSVRALKSPDVYLASFAYAYPAITVHGTSVPVTLHAGSPLFEFRDATNFWKPNDGLFEISDPALISFDFAELVKAANNKGAYTVRISYNRNNLLDDESYDSGKLVARFDFDPECNGIDNSDMEPCQQVALLLDDLEFALNLRALYPDTVEWAKQKNIDVSKKELDQEVIKRLPEIDPYITQQEMDQLLKSAGGTRVDNLEITVPDGCNKCSARPLCQWRTDAIKAHEAAVKAYLESNPAVRNKLRDPNLPRMEDWELTAEVEYNAYNDRAIFLKNLIYQQIADNPGCDFSGEFQSRFDSLINQIK